MRARRDSNPRSQPSEGCALSSYATGAGGASPSCVGRRSGARNVFEEIEFVIHQRPVEFPDAIGMSEEIGSRIREILARTIRHVMRDLDLLHLCSIDGMRAKIARQRGHATSLLAHAFSALFPSFFPGHAARCAERPPLKFFHP